MMRKNDFLLDLAIDTFLTSLASEKPIVDEKATMDIIEAESDKDDIEDLIDLIENKSDSEKDRELSKILLQELIKDIHRAEYKEKNVDIAEVILSPTPIHKVYYEKPMLIVCTDDSCTVEELSEFVGVETQYILDITKGMPIGDQIFMINLDEVYPKECCCRETYNPKSLVEVLKALGEDNLKDIEAESHLNHLVRIAFEDNTELLDDETIILQVNVEDKVVAIGLNTYIDNPPKTIGKALGLNEDLFIQVCGPTSTIVLIDTRRWFLESILNKKASDDLWYL